MAYGHGISVSLIQLARAYTVFATDGELVPLTLVKNELAATSERLISAETARAVRSMLETAVQPGGTGPRARIMGWRVAGKTGTAQVVGLGKDTGANKDHSWFVSYAPAYKPEIATITLIENVGFGGKFAAPATRNLLNVYYKKTRGEDPPGTVPAVKTQIAKAAKTEAPPKKTNNVKKVG